MIDALSEIGPAVIHGGMSTFLAFVLLAASESYVFFTFFKVSWFSLNLHSYFLIITFNVIVINKSFANTIFGLFLLLLIWYYQLFSLLQPTFPSRHPYVCTAQKVSKYRVSFGPYISVLSQKELLICTFLQSIGPTFSFTPSQS